MPAREAAIVLGKHLLGQRLKALRLKQISVGDDGACQFRAFSQHLYGNQKYHLSIRHAVVKHIARERAYYGLMFDEDEFEPYLAGMRRSKTWGDELTLRAFADAYTVFVHVITSTGDHWHLQYAPAGDAPPKRHVFLSYTSPVHYDAITASAPLDDSDHHPSPAPSLGVPPSLADAPTLEEVVSERQHARRRRSATDSTQQPAVLAQALATAPHSALRPKNLKEAREEIDQLVAKKRQRLEKLAAKRAELDAKEAESGGKLEGSAAEEAATLRAQMDEYERGVNKELAELLEKVAVNKRENKLLIKQFDELERREEEKKAAATAKKTLKAQAEADEKARCTLPNHPS